MRFSTQSLSREKHEVSLARSGERAFDLIRMPHRATVPLGGGSCLCRTGHPFAVSGSEEPSQMIEFVFSASPETIRREPLGLIPSLSRLMAGPGSLRIDES